MKRCETFHNYTRTYTKKKIFFLNFWCDLKKGVNILKMSKFRLKNKKIHLTYESHIEPEKLIKWCEEKTKIKIVKYSIVHETGDTGYKHTHFLVEFSDAISTLKCNYFDYNKIHPNITKVSGLEHWDNTVKYHKKQGVPFTNITYIEEENKIIKPKIKNECKGCSKKQCEKGTACKECLKEYEKTREYGAEEMWNKYSSVSEAIQDRCVKNVRSASSIITVMKLKPIDYGPEPKVEWLPWQQQLINEISNEPDDRTITWVYTLGGCFGKTSFSKHLFMWYDVFLATHANAYHIGTTIVNRMKEGREIKTVLINLSKSQDVSDVYQGLEMIKDGLITSKKFNGETIVFNPPHVIVFANLPPDTEKLSIDRWDIRTIDNDGIFKYENKIERLESKKIFKIKEGYSRPGIIKFVAKPDKIIHEVDDECSNSGSSYKTEEKDENSYFEPEEQEFEEEPIELEEEVEEEPYIEPIRRVKNPKFKPSLFEGLFKRG
jgi:hypothetical protein